MVPTATHFRSWRGGHENSQLPRAKQRCSRRTGCDCQKVAAAQLDALWFPSNLTKGKGPYCDRGHASRASLQHLGELWSGKGNGKPQEVVKWVEGQGRLGASLLESRFQAGHPWPTYLTSFCVDSLIGEKKAVKSSTCLLGLLWLNDWAIYTWSSFFFFFFKRKGRTFWQWWRDLRKGVDWVPFAPTLGLQSDGFPETHKIVRWKMSFVPPSHNCPRSSILSFLSSPPSQEGPQNPCLGFRGGEWEWRQHSSALLTLSSEPGIDQVTESLSSFISWD